MLNVIVLNNKSNTLLINCNNKGLLLDTGYDFEDTIKIIQYLRDTNIKLEVVIVSHYHKDHIQGVSLIKKNFPNVIFYSSDITRIIYENDWLESYLYENLVDTRHNIDVKFNILGESFNFYNNRIDILKSSGHCRGNLIFKIGDYLFCPDIIISDSNFLPFVSDVASYLKEIDYLKGIDNVNNIVLTHNKEIMSLNSFCTALDNTKIIIEKSVDKIFELVGERCNFRELLMNAVLTNNRTRCYNTNISKEQLGYTIFVIKNILKYLEEKGKIKIIYNNSITIERVII